MFRDGGGGGGFLDTTETFGAGATVGVASDIASVYSSSSVEEGDDIGVSGAESNGFEGPYPLRTFARTSSVA